MSPQGLTYGKGGGEDVASAGGTRTEGVQDGGKEGGKMFSS